MKVSATAWTCAAAADWPAENPVILGWRSSFYRAAWNADAV